MTVETFKEPTGEISCIGYFENFLDPQEVADIQKHLEAMDDWRGDTPDYGHIAPRMQKWYHQEMKPFASTWHKQYPRWQPFQYSKYWQTIQELVVSRYNRTVAPLLPQHITVDATPDINSILMNYYRGGTDSIKKHRDSQPEFGENPTVIGISIGSTRTLRFERILWEADSLASIRPDMERQHQNRDYVLHSGSLIVMAGTTQKYFCHSIPKDSTVHDRYSLTFRKHSQEYL